jgi:DMSO/TMAO reductase YedYZ molybdopterin-dependent catalytic subunit
MHVLRVRFAGNLTVPWKGSVMSSFRARLVSVVATLTLMLGVVSASTPVVALAQDSTPAAGTSASASTNAIQLTGIVGNVTLTVDELKALPNESMDVTFMSGKGEQQHSFTGTSLYGVLEHVGLHFPEGAKNPMLKTYLIVTANDGYQVVISGGELDPAFGNVPMLLAWEQDGAALEGTDGPIRLVVPGDTKGGRYVSGVVSIEVVSIDPSFNGAPASTPVPAATPVG